MKRSTLLVGLLLVAMPVPSRAMKGFGGAKAAPAPKGPPPPKLQPRPVVVMPEGFVGKEKDVLAALFPDGVSDASEAPDGARLREAHRWVTGGRTYLAVLVDRWAGKLCEMATCDPQPTDLAVLEGKGTVMTVVGRLPSVGHHGGPVTVAFDAEPRRLNLDTTMLGVREESLIDGKKEGTLRLFHVGGGELHGVFDRHVESTTPAPKGKKPPGCIATVRSDEFGTPPYAMKISEHCTSTGKTSTELWRWDGNAYRRHGPPSDAEQGDEAFRTDIDEPSR
jgi:hypothetical protein